MYRLYVLSRPCFIHQNHFIDLMKFVQMLLLMDCLARLFYGGSVRKEDMVFKDIEDMNWKCLMCLLALVTFSCVLRKSLMVLSHRGGRLIVGRLGNTSS